MKVVAVDPGESTGYAVFTDALAPEHAGTVDLWDFIRALAGALQVHGLTATITDANLVEQLYGVEHVVVEDWALYPWELQNLGWDKCRTARGIGAIEFICQTAGVPYTLQPASIKDAAEGLGAEELFYRPLHENRHQNDAIRHGVFWRAMRSRDARGRRT